MLRGYDIRFHGAHPLVQGQPEPAPGPLLARFRGQSGKIVPALKNESEKFSSFYS